MSGKWLAAVRHIRTLAGPILLLLCTMWLIKKWMLTQFTLPEAAYEHSWIAIEALRNLHFGSMLIMLLIAGVFLHTGKLKSLFSPWTVFENHRKLQWLATVLATLLGWSYATYGYNYYFNQSHLADRWLLLLLIAGVYWRPVFLLPFVSLTVALMGQFIYPLGPGYSRQIDLLLLETLLLVLSAFLLRPFVKRVNSKALVFLIFCLLAAHYWVPAWGKIKLNWMTHGHLNYFIAGAYTHGWLNHLSAEQVSRWVIFVERLDWPMRLATLALEAGALLFFWRRKFAVLLILGWMLFHLGAFLMSGFLFWKWILLELALLFWLLRKPSEMLFAGADRRYLLISIAVIGFGKLWFSPPGLAWYDTNLSYGYRLQAHTVTGAQVVLSPSLFSGYSDIMSFTDFGYLCDKNQLVNSYGATRNRPLAEKLLTTDGDPDTIRAMEHPQNKWGVILHKRAQFAKFIDRYFTNTRNSPNAGLMLSAWHPPGNFWTFGNNINSDDLQNIDTVRVFQNVGFFDKTTYRQIRNEMVYVIPIGQGL